MGTMTIRLPDDTHERLRDLAQRRKVSLNRLMEELSTQALAYRIGGSRTADLVVVLASVFRGCRADEPPGRPCGSREGSSRVHPCSVRRGDPGCKWLKMGHVA
jgi:hypothetical protein